MTSCKWADKCIFSFWQHKNVKVFLWTIVFQAAWKRAQQLPTSLGHAVHRGKNTTHPTTCNKVCKRKQHVTSNNSGSCWPTMLSPFARGFTLELNPVIFASYVYVKKFFFRSISSLMRFFFKLSTVFRIIVSAVPQGGGEHLLKSFVAYGIRSTNTTSSSRSPYGLRTLTNYTS